MDWILTALALFNLLSMFAIYRDRHSERVVSPLTLFAISLVVSELSWLWLPVQATVAVMLLFLGALSSSLGSIAFVVLLGSWIALIRSIQMAFRSTRLTEMALQQELGANYRQKISETVTDKLETETSFKEWYNPFRMSKPDVEKLKNISYGPSGIKHRLDIYRPREIPEEGCPVLMQIHGGAWMIGSKDQQALPLMHYMASKGWICVAINYRLSPSVGFPAHIEDCKRALAWIRSEGHNYGMNPDFVAVTGGSAGGHLCALMGLTENLPELQKELPDIDTSVQAIVPFYGVYDFLGRFDMPNREMFVRFIHNRIIFESPEENPQLWDLASPITHINAQCPPCMIIQGEIDSLTTVTGARVFHNELQKISNQAAVYLELPGAEHAFDVIHSPRTDAVIKGVHRFLEWSRTQHINQNV